MVKVVVEKSGNGGSSENYVHKSAKRRIDRDRTASKSLLSKKPFVPVQGEGCKVEKIGEGMELVQIGDYRVVKKMGEGTFSTVYCGFHKEHRRGAALKRIRALCTPTHMVNEVRMLQKCSGCENVTTLHEVLRTDHYVTLVLDHFKHDEFPDYLPHMNLDDIKSYMLALLAALKNIHERGVVHRDLKPGNFLHSRIYKTYKLIDFGLAHMEAGFVESKDRIAKLMSQRGSRTVQEILKPALLGAESAAPGVKSKGKKSVLRKHAQRGGTRGFRAPEVLLHSTHQTTKIDTWSAGVILLSLLTNHYPFFESNSDADALVEICIVLGARRIREAASTLGELTTVTTGGLPEEGIDFRSFVKKDGSRDYEIPEAAWDLCRKLMEPNPVKRLSAQDAISHPFLSRTMPPP